MFIRAERVVDSDLVALALLSGAGIGHGRIIARYIYHARLGDPIPRLRISVEQNPFDALSYFQFANPKID